MSHFATARRPSTGSHGAPKVADKACSCVHAAERGGLSLSYAETIVLIWVQSIREKSGVKESGNVQVL
jgi:hypothetical protein